MPMMAWGGRAWGEPGADPEGFKTSAMMAPTKATQSLSRPWWTGVVPRASSQPQDQYHGSNTFVAQGAAPPACAFGGKAGAGLWANGTVVSYERLSRDDRVQLSLLSLKLRLALFPEIFSSANSTGERHPPLSFSGRVAMNKIITEGFAPNKQAAIHFANRLLHVGVLCGTAGPAIFSPDASSLYWFAVDRFALHSNGNEEDDLVDVTRSGGAMAGFSFPTLAELAQSMQSDHGGLACTVGANGVRGFPGREAVDWLLNKGLAISRERAASMASALARAGVFADEAGRQNFRDGATRYNFAEDRFMVAVWAAARSCSSICDIRSNSGGGPMSIDLLVSMADTVAARQLLDASGHTEPSMSPESSLCSHMSC